MDCLSGEPMEFRLAVCLTRIFNDERSYCYIYLDKSYEKISVIERYLRRLFRLKGEFCLMVNNYLLPSEQPTKIISPGDILTVTPLQKGWHAEAEAAEPDVVETELNVEDENATTGIVEVAGADKISKKKKKKKSKAEPAEATVNIEDDHLTKKEVSISPVEFPSSSSRKQDKKDSDMDVSMGSDADREEERSPEREAEADEESDIEEQQRTAEVQSTIQQLKLKALSLLNEASVQRPAAGVSGGRINKRKRIRKRNKNTSLSMSTPDLTDSATAVPLTFKPVKKSASHIRFDNESPVIVQNALRNPEVSISPRIIHAVENRSVTIPRRNSLCPNADSQSTPAIDCIPQAMPILNGNSKSVVVPNKTVVTIDAMKKRLNEFPVMDDVYPVPKDLVLFKMLRIGADYLPGVSDFILASVMEVEKDNDLVRVSVVDGRSECVQPSGKFELEPPPELALDEPLTLDVTWAQVVEPRLVFP